jgi:hypothetical protein
MGIHNAETCTTPAVRYVPIGAKVPTNRWRSLLSQHLTIFVALQDRLV